MKQEGRLPAAECPNGIVAGQIRSAAIGEVSTFARSQEGVGRDAHTRPRHVRTPARMTTIATGKATTGSAHHRPRSAFAPRPTSTEREVSAEDVLCALTDGRVRAELVADLPLSAPQ